ncbi:MAG: FHA domain-containing protein [Deltaproteobacteria bacterium]
MDVTQKEPNAGWGIEDGVDALRILATAVTFDLAAPEIVIGGAADCGIVLDDPTRCVSRHHAKLVRQDTKLVVSDSGSTNGIWQDGERRLSFELSPGCQVKIGGVTLVAESPRLRVLRAYLERAIGWGESRREDVDNAIAAIRGAVRSRAALALCGMKQLVDVARSLHVLTMGSARPFVVADEDHEIDEAGGGTLCIDLARTSRTDAAALALDFQDTSERGQLVVCAQTRADIAALALERVFVMELPMLTTRREEFEQLIHMYIDDAVRDLGADGPALNEHEMTWLRHVPIDSLTELEELARRLVAVRNWGPTAGAQRLGITHVALGKWLRRRKIPT